MHPILTKHLALFIYNVQGKILETQIELRLERKPKGFDFVDRISGESVCTNVFVTAVRSSATPNTGDRDFKKWKFSFFPVKDMHCG